LGVEFARLEGREGALHFINTILSGRFIKTNFKNKVLPLKLLEKNPEFTAVAKLGLPIVINHGTLSLMQFTDAWIAGKIGSTELAAIMPASVMISLLSVFGMEALSSVTLHVSQTLGKKREASCGPLAWQGIYCGILFGWLCLIYYPTASIIFSSLFASQSGDPVQFQTLVELETQYFQVSLLGLAPIMACTALGNFFTGLGRSRIMMGAAIIGVGANILLSYGLAFGALGMPNLGFVGIAWGTLFATFIQAIVLLVCFAGPARMRAVYNTHRAAFVWKRASKLIRVGLPAGLHGSVDFLAWGVLLTWLISFSGEAHLAAQAIMVRCITISFLPAEGMASALSTLVGKSVGKRDYLEARRYTRAAFILIATWMTFMAGIYVIFSQQIIALFTSDEAVVAAASSAILWVAAFQFFDAMNVTYSNALQGVGDVAWPSAVNLTISLVVLLAGGLMVVNFLPGTGSSGVWAIATLYVVVHGVAYSLRWRSRIWQHRRFLLTA
jgi:multidrug resistance protein, MATE family